MPRPLEGTPCPSSAPNDELLHIQPNQSSYTFLNGDTTSNIDFTTELQPSFRAAGVRRRATAIRSRRPGNATDFAVHQDERIESTKHLSNRSQRPFIRADKPPILAQPAQRPRTGVNFLSGNTQTTASSSTTTTGSPHHSSAANSVVGAQQGQGKTTGQSAAGSDKAIKKPARRGTMYIPSEDTTMPTVWMGVFSPIKDIGARDENSVADPVADLTGIAAQMARKRGLQKSSAMAALQRAPLRHSLRPLQETTISEDIPGQLTGKENLPPGHELAGKEKSKKSKILVDSSKQAYEAPTRTGRDTRRRPKSAYFVPQNLSSKTTCSTQSIQAGTVDGLPIRVGGTASNQDINGSLARLCLNDRERGSVQAPLSSLASTANPQWSSADRTKNLPAKIMIPKVTGTVLDQSYPLLSEDIQKPSLYENNWLAHQEIAITQLVNNLFGAAQGVGQTGDTFTTRSQVLATYQDQSFVLLQKRLQASLLYGSLALPKEILIKSSRLPEDLGMKQKFLDFWLKTYDLQTLQSCAEVVIGRECSNSPRTSSGAQNSTSPTGRMTSKQNLSRYLDTFLIRNEDTSAENVMLAPGANGVQRTVLRSLMLIKLLDEAKTLPQTPFTGCLFQPSSPHKSSVAVVQAMTQILNPVAGNIIRSLSQLNYSLNHIQYPLEEFDYQINNLAVDLRDGVRLTRLVEQLLYPSSSRLLSYTTDGDATATIMMPTGEVLSLVQGEHDWPLSQYLKLPCLGRATKLYNVQIALSALSGIKGVGKIVEDITASDIVDGFREKTVALLWGLASKWGLGSLIDWADLKHEIRRLGGILEEEDDDDADANNFSQHKILLKAWASAVAARKGVKVNNLTTSFADGKVFESIVKEYEVYLAASKSSSKSTSKAGRHLSQRLAGLGCSAQFGK
jgi:abnormal spindle-like microcephaly-associated protein